MNTQFRSDTTGFRAHVLIAEDDGPSGRFFVTAFTDMHCRADLATTGQQAIDLAREHAYDLLLLDCRMPDFGAMHVLSTLRGDPVAASHASPAIASSAELDAGQKRYLRRIGFVDAVGKPLSLQALRELAMAWLPASPDGGTTPEVLDDRAAIASSGSAESVAALRQLFVRELSRLRGELDQYASRNDELSERLHRLLASCGFCGATSLSEATRQLKRQLDAGVPVDSSELRHFRETLADTLDALTRTGHENPQA